MEPNAMPGGIYSNIQPGSMLGLEMSLHRPLPPPQNPHLLQNPNPHMLNYAHHDELYHPQSTHQSAKQAHPISTKSKTQTLALSDDDDPGFTAENSADDGKKNITSPWQRMKWTDSMIRLLIMVVFYIGDEVVSEANNDTKKKVVGGGGSGFLQKKGKWKSVSRAMMERGFYVSPQQCEDKFNDLNKRYKRVNEILGKGVSCRVVENQSLLDSMDHISPKMKEEVRKLLNSKHLFFREMCAYHNSCGHGGAGGVGGGIQVEPPPSVVAQRCLHSTATNNNNNNNVVPNLNRVENEGIKLSKGTNHDDYDDDDNDDNDDDDGDDAHDDDDDAHDGDDDDDMNFSDSERLSLRKRLKRGTLINSSPSIQQLDYELANVLQDASKSPSEKSRWMKTKLVRLEEELVGIQSRSFEIEKQRLKWLKFSSKKEREMEREKLTNERLRLENERMSLIVRQKELDLIDHHHHLQQQYSSNRKSDPSSVTG